MSVAPGRPGGNAAVSVIAHVDVAPNPAVRADADAPGAASRQEPGNLRFDVLQHTMRGNHFTVIETWRDQAALDTHVSAPHTSSIATRCSPSPAARSTSASSRRRPSRRTRTGYFASAGRPTVRPGKPAASK